jgi:hypothetical protein
MLIRLTSQRCEYAFSPPEPNLALAVRPVRPEPGKQSQMQGFGKKNAYQIQKMVCLARVQDRNGFGPWIIQTRSCVIARVGEVNPTQARGQERA